MKISYPESRYLSGDYLHHNPSWDMEDSPWKAKKIINILETEKITPNSICDIGCGAGGVLAELRKKYAHAQLFGFDISPDATRFWPQHANSNITFQVGDIFQLNNRKYGIILLLDVLEHVPDPHSFLIKCKEISKNLLLHFPLDLNAINVLRERPILKARRNVGHIHYFTKNIALSLLKECGLKVVAWKYSGAGFNGPHRSLKTIFASIPRQLVYALNKDIGVKLLGGETLFVLAKNKVADLMDTPKS